MATGTTTRSMGLPFELPALPAALLEWTRHGAEGFLGLLRGGVSLAGRGTSSLLRVLREGLDLVEAVSQQAQAEATSVVDGVARKVKDLNI